MLARTVYVYAAAAVCFVLAIVLFSPAQGQQEFDFEARYLVHEGQQIWDFCLTQVGSEFHVFYHTIPPDIDHPAGADTIWHAVTEDMLRWDMRGPVLTSGPEWWDAEAVWAPDVVYDGDTDRWAMLYTGVSAGMVQRACLAWSEDLDHWVKDANNPVFEPDSLTYYWAPDQNWSSFRDPYVYYDGGVWNMLNTAGLRLGEYPGYKRAIVHRAVSYDLVNWVDAGVFFEHDGETGQWHDFESVQYHRSASQHHLFFVEQDPSLPTHSTSRVSGHSPSDWTMADRVFVDDGWAPEVQEINGFWFNTMFGRLHQYDDPHSGQTNIVVRFDQMGFRNGGRVPVIDLWDPLRLDWPTRFGEVGEAAPCFGDNPLLRGDDSVNFEGHGWFSSYENYGGPLSGVGEPGAILGDQARGGLKSRDFTITSDFLVFLIAGGHYPETCYLALVDPDTEEILMSATGAGGSFMTRRTWDLREMKGRNVKLVIMDDEAGSEGWIALDSIKEVNGTFSPAGDDTPGAPTVASVYPNPFNPSTTVSFRLGKPAHVTLTVHDLAGRRVRELASRSFASGSHEVVWNGQDAAGRSVPSGSYFIRLTDGNVDESHKVLLLK